MDCNKMDSRKGIHLRIYKQYILRSAPYLFWTLLSIVTVLLLIELSPSPSSWPYKDKFEHIAAFAALTTCGHLAYKQKKRWIYCGLAAYGLLMEWAQGAFTLTREASIYDWVADVVGILLFLAITRFLKKHPALTNIA